MKMKDILIFMTDQHSGRVLGVNGDKIVKTPNLDRIAREGVNFQNAYTSCPLCVPARMSMLSGLLPSKTNVMTNNNSLSSEIPTFLHNFAIAGYETVLCGRMHFIGADQRHGFTKRIFDDFTNTDIGDNKTMRKELGEVSGTLGEKNCLKVVGVGNSPILEYDKAVVKRAIEYLNEKHDKPQCIVVGTYAPHFTYIAPEKWFDYYIDKVQLPMNKENDAAYLAEGTKHKEQQCDNERILQLRACYYGMISNLDEQVGLVEKSFSNYLEENNKQGLFVYLSDHGDQIGEKNLYGKKTMFEFSSKIPLIFKGDGINRNSTKFGAASIMDLGKTICDYASVEQAKGDGESLFKQLIEDYDDVERIVISETFDENSTGAIFGRMAKQDDLKLIAYEGAVKEKMLFNTRLDSYETQNIYSKCDNNVETLDKMIYNEWDIDKIQKQYELSKENDKTIAKFNQLKKDCLERWAIPSDLDLKFLKL